jgi:hypothetical protein
MEFLMTTRQQIDSFHRFALEQIDNGGADLTIDDLYELWRIANPTDSERADTVAAVKAAYADFEAGDSGQPARQELRETCDRLGLVIDW